MNTLFKNLEKTTPPIVFKEVKKVIYYLKKENKKLIEENKNLKEGNCIHCLSMEKKRRDFDGWERE